MMSLPSNRRISAEALSGGIVLAIVLRWRFFVAASGVDISSLLFGIKLHSMSVGSAKDIPPLLATMTKFVALLPLVSVVPKHVFNE